MNITLSNVLPNADQGERLFFVCPVDPVTLQRLPGVGPTQTLGKYLKFYDTYNKATESTECAWAPVDEIFNAAFSNSPVATEPPVDVAAVRAKLSEIADKVYETVKLL